MTKIVEIEITNQDFIDINKFCELNDIKEIGGYLNLCLRKGHYLEKYGLLNQGTLPDVIEREFEKEVLIEDNSKIEELQNEIYILKGKLEDKKEVECGKLQETLFELNRQLSDKNNTIKEMTKKVNELEDMTKTSYAFYLRNSNLTDRL